MALVELAPAGAGPVSVAEARSWLRVGHEDEDELIAALLDAACARVEHLTGRVLIARSFRETLDAWPASRVSFLSGAVRVAAGPLISVEAVRIYDAQGAAKAWSPDEYRVETGTDPGRIIPLAPYALPRPGRRAGGIEIDFTAGYGAEPDDVPAPLREAVLRLVSESYGGRHAPEARRGEAGLPEGVAHLIRPYRSIRL
ncbi:hypothetical protein F1654_04630 [Alkalicaulis satelles]|uniref:Phage gp6-like head-tail connector protein n=1 Tax=Alkalicaulis satelles TaxID=2609175 RepID=A0A5M6ZLR7_9PROT|nr:phage head-tail connector protein [Alkalicaulis satelles]KAA5805270.1 hypothetical protein F1654_04630 [Alkalicaulis satelles]